MEDKRLEKGEIFQEGKQMRKRHASFFSGF